MEKQKIAILGGTGALGTGLALRWIKADYPVIIGSRESQKAVAAADHLQEKWGVKVTQATDNVSAAEAGDIVVLTVPFAHQRSTLNSVQTQLKGKILIDVTVALAPPKVARVQLPPEGSAGIIAQNLLGEAVNVVSAFQNVPADALQSEQSSIDCDVLVTGNNVEAREIVIQLAAKAGMRAFHARPIDNSVATEALTSLLISINKRYKAHSGIRITGIHT